MPVGGISTGKFSVLGKSVVFVTCIGWDLFLYFNACTVYCSGGGPGKRVSYVLCCALYGSWGKRGY